MLTEQQVTQIKGMKSSLQALRMIADECPDVETAEAINLEVSILAGKIAVLEGTPAKYGAPASFDPDGAAEFKALYS